MISTKKLIKIAKKWQTFVVSHRKRIAFHSEKSNADECTATATTTLKAGKGHFVVYSADQQRFEIPIIYLNNEIFRVLFEVSEEEFGLPNDGPIVLAVDGQVLDYMISVIRRGVTGDVHKALLSTLAINRCSSLHQEMRHEQLLVY